MPFPCLCLCPGHLHIFVVHSWHDPRAPGACNSTDFLKLHCWRHWAFMRLLYGPVWEYFTGPMERMNQGVKQVFKLSRRWKGTHSHDMIVKQSDRDMILFKVRCVLQGLGCFLDL